MFFTNLKLKRNVGDFSIGVLIRPYIIYILHTLRSIVSQKKKHGDHSDAQSLQKQVNYYFQIRKLLPHISVASNLLSLFYFPLLLANFLIHINSIVVYLYSIFPLITYEDCFTMQWLVLYI